MEENTSMESEVMKQILIDYYVNLQRIKNCEKNGNEELEYQLKIYENKLAVLGIQAKDFEITKSE